MTESRKRRPIESEIPNPRELLRARHPDLFSDSTIVDRRQLPRAVFEYHLDSLTSRKQEYEFENFCRKLAEKELCPNLTPQTGPTGGGDSKVDTETYPVADAISERWWVGSPSAGKERWAFAISAKKDWKPKVKSDVRSVLSTGREYASIFFFTNQFVRDKERAALEDKLKKQSGVPVRIFERNWIVDKVYENDHLDLAVSTLNILDAETEQAKRWGPNDSQRTAELEDLDRQISDPSMYRGTRYQLVEDCIRTAVLARGLERPRAEVNGRFDRADRLAAELNYQPQRLRVAYNRAWTAFWWHEDFVAFNRFYDQVESLTESSTQSSEADLLLNLWLLLEPSVHAGRISETAANVELRRRRLSALLQPLADESTRPNNALRAQTGLILIRAVQARQSEDSKTEESCWHELQQIVDESEKLGAYPFERLSKVVIELGESMDSAGFDLLYEKVVDAISRRRSEGEAGQAYFDRATQKLQLGKPYEAIAWFGRSEKLLIKDEYVFGLILSLIGSSYAYEQVGLLWAARLKALAAADRALHLFAEDGEMVRPTLTAFQRLVWLELQIGRVPHVLNSMVHAEFIASQLNMSEEQIESFAEERQLQDAVLAIHFLNLPTPVLSATERIPATLDRLQLDRSRMALLYLLGYENTLRDEGYIPEDEPSDSVRKLFEQLQDQPAAEDISPSPLLGDGETIALKSTILGTELVVEAENNSDSLGLAESLLGALEAFIATTDEDDVFPHCERFRITVAASDALNGVPTLTFHSQSTRADVVHPSNLQPRTGKDRHDFITWLQDSVVQLLCRILIIRDPEAWIERVAGRESGFDRALSFGEALVLSNNVFGEKLKSRLTDWPETGDKTYPYLREGPWRPNTDSNLPQPDGPDKSPGFGDGPPPAGMPDRSRAKHSDRRVLSPIEVPLWDQAKWCATAFAEIPGAPPMIALAFEDGQSGQAIFRNWRQRWGTEDKKDELRLAVIRGLSKRRPSEYAVVIGPNLRILEAQEKKMFLVVSRINRMTPANPENLDNFVRAFENAGAYLLAPAQMDTPIPTLFPELAVLKRRLNLREAWEIGQNDPDAAALDVDDEPVIPTDVSDAPVLKALKWIRSMRINNS